MGDWEVERGEGASCKGKDIRGKKNKNYFIFGNSVQLGEDWEQPEIRLWKGRTQIFDDFNAVLLILQSLCLA